MINHTIHFIILPSGGRKVCFSKSQFERVLRYEGWTRAEARAAIELYADTYPDKWAFATVKRDPVLKVFSISTTVGKATLDKLKSFWKARTTDLSPLFRVPTVLNERVLS